MECVIAQTIRFDQEWPKKWFYLCQASIMDKYIFDYVFVWNAFGVRFYWCCVKAYMFWFTIINGEWKRL